MRDIYEALARARSFCYLVLCLLAFALHCIDLDVAIACSLFSHPPLLKHIYTISIFICSSRLNVVRCAMLLSGSLRLRHSTSHLLKSLPYNLWVSFLMYSILFAWRKQWKPCQEIIKPFTLFRFYLRYTTHTYLTIHMHVDKCSQLPLKHTHAHIKREKQLQRYALQTVQKSHVVWNIGPWAVFLSCNLISCYFLPSSSCFYSRFSFHFDALPHRSRIRWKVVELLWQRQTKEKKLCSDEMKWIQDEFWKKYTGWVKSTWKRWFQIELAVEYGTAKTCNNCNIIINEK